MYLGAEFYRTRQGILFSFEIGFHYLDQTSLELVWSAGISET